MSTKPDPHPSLTSPLRSKLSMSYEHATLYNSQNTSIPKSRSPVSLCCKKRRTSWRKWVRIWKNSINRVRMSSKLIRSFWKSTTEVARIGRSAWYPQPYWSTPQGFRRASSKRPMPNYKSKKSRTTNSSINTSHLCKVSTNSLKNSTSTPIHMQHNKRSDNPNRKIIKKIVISRIQLSAKTHRIWDQHVQKYRIRYDQYQQADGTYTTQWLAIDLFAGERACFSKSHHFHLLWWSHSLE